MTVSLPPPVCEANALSLTPQQTGFNWNESEKKLNLVQTGHPTLKYLQLPVLDSMGHIYIWMTHKDTKVKDISESDMQQLQRRSFTKLSVYQ